MDYDQLSIPQRDIAQNIRFHMEDAINELIKIKGILCCIYIDSTFHIYKSKQGT